MALLISIILTAITTIKKGHMEGSGKVFFIFLPIGMAVSLYAGLVDMSFFVISFLVAIVLIYFEIKRSE